MAEKVLWAADDLNLNIGRQVIFDHAAVSISDGERVALVGRNGCGKSTLLRIIAGKEFINGGGITAMRNLRVAYMPQEFELDPNAVISDVVREGLSFFSGLIRRYEALSPTSAEHDSLEHMLILHDAWNMESRLASIMDRLNLPPGARLCGELSGGEKRRVMLARSVIAEPDLLLLDEPTNHLDVETVAWIEDFLDTYKGACFFVTHDRYFLDRLSSRILELDNGRFYSYTGTYADFLAAKAEREYNEDVIENKRKSFLRREIEWVRRSPKARLRRNLGRLKNYSDIAAQSGPQRVGDIDLLIPTASRLGNKGVDLKNVSLSLGGKKLFGGFDFEFTANRKIGIVGANGSGKTSLLRVITGQMPPDSGEVVIAPNVEFNYVDQSRVALDPEKTVCDELGEGHEHVQLGTEKISVWGYLRRFMFEDERINTKVKYLSGGEKARLVLAKILKKGGNFLILDEPTNDLDLSSLRILEEALVNYDGCLLLVSHDRYFLNRVCDSIIAFEPDGQLCYSVGDYDYYISKKRERMGAAQSPPLEQKKQNQLSPAPEKKNVQTKLSFKEERELKLMEESIFSHESEISEIETMISVPDFFTTRSKEFPELKAKLDKLKSELETAYRRWEELETKKQSFAK